MDVSAITFFRFCSHVRNIRFVFLTLKATYVHSRFGEQDLVTVNDPDNDLLYTHMGSIGYHTDFLLGSR